MSAEEPRQRDQDRNASRAPDGKTVPEQEYEDQVKSGEDPDVLLDVPVLNVEELNLELKDLRVHVSLRANLADLVSVNVGVDAYLDEVKLEIKGIEAQALLKVRLDRVLETFNHALDTIDRNPEILGGRPRDAEDPVRGWSHADDATGEGAGQTVQRSVDEAGNLMETVLDDSGAVTEERITGNVEDLPIEQEHFDDEGRTVARARDDLGNVVESTLDEQGDIVGANVLENDRRSDSGVDLDSDNRTDVQATTAAEKKARELGVDLSSMNGSGSGGRILVKDIEEAAEGSA